MSWRTIRPPVLTPFGDSKYDLLAGVNLKKM